MLRGTVRALASHFFPGRSPALGTCETCRHDWREHLPADGGCSECVYEIEHEDPDAPTVVCRLTPSGPTVEGR